MRISNKSSRNCLICGKTFKFFPSQAKFGNPRFCSHDCHYVFFRENGFPKTQRKLIKKCETCGKEISVLKRDAPRKRFCSQRCLIIWRTKNAIGKKPGVRLELSCKNCGVTFSRLKSQTLGGRGQFCSRNCSGIWRVRKGNTGRSSGELQLANLLRSDHLDFQEQIQIGPWLVDFYFPNEGLAVEYDGIYWHSLPQMMARDRRKDGYFKYHNLPLLRIGELEFQDDPASAIQLIKEKLEECHERKNRTQGIPS